MEDLQKVFERYRELVRRIDGLADRTVSRFPEQFHCQPGCSACCQQFTVLPLEAEILRKAISELDQIPEQTDGRNCPLLTEDGRCAVYASRPIICRTHGLPVLSTETGGVVDCCPMNFTDFPLEDIDRSSVLNLDVLNSILVTLNALYLKASGRDPRSDQRTAIAQLME